MGVKGAVEEGWTDLLDVFLSIKGRYSASDEEATAIFVCLKNTLSIVLPIQVVGFCFCFLTFHEYL